MSIPVVIFFYLPHDIWPRTTKIPPQAPKQSAHVNLCAPRPWISGFHYLLMLSHLPLGQTPSAFGCYSKALGFPLLSRHSSFLLLWIFNLTFTYLLLKSYSLASSLLILYPPKASNAHYSLKKLPHLFMPRPDDLSSESQISRLTCPKQPSPSPFQGPTQTTTRQKMALFSPTCLCQKPENHSFPADRQSSQFYLQTHLKPV